MSQPNMTSVAVQARALPAPNYMGLPQAKHIYVVTQDRDLDWPCFGRGYTAQDPGDVVNDANIYKEWALHFAQPTVGDQYLGGVANTVNGTCHTLANRILSLSEDKNANVSKSIDDAFSVMVFGKYGFGTNQFCKLLTDSFEKAAETCSAPAGLLETVIGRVRSPFKDELQAWEIVILQMMNIDVAELLKSQPSLADAALDVMQSYCLARDAMYESIFDYRQNRAPTADETAKILTALKALALEYVHGVLSALTIKQIISQAQFAAFEQAIKNYVDQMRV